MWFSLILIIIFTFLLVLLNIYFKKQHNLPTGPKGLPIIGYFPFLGSNVLHTIQQLSEKYGAIMKLKLLGENYYFLNSFEVVQEALKINGTTFAGRPFNEFNLLSYIQGKRCVINSEGEIWRIQQKFYTSKLSGLGMGKNDFGNKIHEICDDLVDYIEEREEISDLMRYMSNFTSNVISFLLFSKKYRIDDPEYIKLAESVHLFNRSGTHMYYSLTGKWMYLISRFNLRFWRMLNHSKQEMMQTVERLMKDRLETGCEAECNDVLDYCLKEMKGSNAHLFDKKNTIYNFLLIFGAGTDTTASTLNFAFYFMATHPEVQQKVFQEIDDTFGKEYRVLLSDVEKLNFTRAVISECQRFACIVPFGILHVNKEAVNIGGFNIPKRSKIITNIYKLSRDPQRFKNPNVFDVNNFLDENKNYVANDANIPFGTGYRRCLGQRLAEMEICIAFTRLIQEFQWLPANEEKMKYEVIESLTRCLSPFTVIAKLRL